MRSVTPASKLVGAPYTTHEWATRGSWYSLFPTHVFLLIPAFGWFIIEGDSFLELLKRETKDGKNLWQLITALM